jgi:crossover junction endodeoxyribonuclease RuvC
VTRILGIDPGSVKLGWAIVDVYGDRLTLTASGMLRAKAAWDKYRRLGKLGQDLADVMDRYRLPTTPDIRIDVMAIEAGFVRGQLGALTLGAARGVCGYLAATRGIPVVEHTSTAVKLAVAGHGHADKDAMLRAVSLIFSPFGTRVDDYEENEADAIAVAITHARAQEKAGT